MQKLIILDINDFYLTSIHSLPLTFPANGIKFSLEGPSYSQSVPEMNVADPPLCPGTHTIDPGLEDLCVLASLPSDGSGVST